MDRPADKKGRGRPVARAAMTGLAAAGLAILGYALSTQVHPPAPALSSAGRVAPVEPIVRIPKTGGGGPVTTPSAPEAAPSEPTELEVPAIGVSSSLVDLGLEADRTVQVPSSFSQAGWYRRSARCGQPGPTVILGHVDSNRGPGVFFRLGALHPGDAVVLHCADGRREQFGITGVRQYPKDGFPTAAVYGPSVMPTIRLVTCGGAFDRASGHYVANVVAFGQMTGQT